MSWCGPELVGRPEPVGGPELVGGPEPAAVVLSDPDPAWASWFVELAALVRDALGATALRVEHIASMSVPGFAAKPVVDLLVVVPDPADEPAYLPALERAGLVLRVREPGFDEHRMLRTASRDAHVHVFGPESPEVERYLLLRELLHEDAAARTLSETTERRLTEQVWATTDDDAVAKTAVVEQLLAEARARGLTGRPTASQSSTVSASSSTPSAARASRTTRNDSPAP